MSGAIMQLAYNGGMFEPQHGKRHCKYVWVYKTEYGQPRHDEIREELCRCQIGEDHIDLSTAPGAFCRLDSKSRAQLPTTTLSQIKRLSQPES